MARQKKARVDMKGDITFLSALGLLLTTARLHDTNYSVHICSGKYSILTCVIYIYIYCVCACLTIYVCETLLHSGSTDNMSRKRSLSEKETDNLKRCLKIPGISEEHVRQVWNIAGQLREDACEASKRQLYNVVRQRLDGSASCFL